VAKTIRKSHEASSCHINLGQSPDDDTTNQGTMRGKGDIYSTSLMTMQVFSS